VQLELKCKASCSIYSEFTDLILKEQEIKNLKFKPIEKKEEGGSIKGVRIESEFTIPYSPLIQGQEVKICRSHIQAQIQERFYTMIQPILDSFMVQTKCSLIKADKEFVWLNEESITKDLEKKGYKVTKYIVGTQILSTSISDEAHLSFDLFRGYESLPPEDQKEISRVMRWVEKGLKEEDHYDQFICYWIAYNGLYNMVWNHRREDLPREKKETKKQKGEREKFETLIDELFADGNTAEYFVKNLRKGYAQELEKIPRSKNVKNVSNDLIFIQDLVCSIYSVRNCLFHGDLSLEERNEKVKSALPLLKEIVILSLKETLLKGILLPERSMHD